MFPEWTLNIPAQLIIYRLVHCTWRPRFAKRKKVVGNLWPLHWFWGFLRRLIWICEFLALTKFPPYLHSSPHSLLYSLRLRQEIPKWGRNNHSGGRGGVSDKGNRVGGEAALNVTKWREFQMRVLRSFLERRLYGSGIMLNSTIAW